MGKARARPWAGILRGDCSSPTRRRSRDFWLRPGNRRRRVLPGSGAYGMIAPGVALVRLTERNECATAPALTRYTGQARSGKVVRQCNIRLFGTGWEAPFVASLQQALGEAECTLASRARATL